MAIDTLQVTSKLFERFDALRDSGVCSPTTRDLLDSAQEMIADRFKVNTTYDQLLDAATAVRDCLRPERKGDALIYDHDYYEYMETAAEALRAVGYHVPEDLY